MPDPINMQQGSGQTATQAGGAANAGKAGTGQVASSGGGGNTQILDHVNNPALSEAHRKHWAEVEAKYVVPRLIRSEYHQLIPLIMETESMNEEEREYWFQILPIMTEEQIKKFVGILENEQEQLKKLDDEYDTELEKLNDKHMLEWQEFEAKEKREKIQKAEAEHEAKEAEKQDALLGELDNL